MTFGVFVFQGRAATRRVDNLTDDGARNACTNGNVGDCSLRGAIGGAAAGDTILFASPLFDSAQTITLDVGLTINKNLTVNGTGARLLTVRRDASNTNSFTIFLITNNATITLSGMTVTGGNQSGINNSTGAVTLDRMHITGNSAGAGGGVYNSATMIIFNSLVDDNTASSVGAGINNVGTMTIANTTIHDNAITGSATSGGGAINNNGATLNMNNVTVTGNTNNNTSSSSAGGIFVTGTCNLRNTLIAANSSGGPNQDVTGTFTSNGNNLVRDTTGSTGFSTANNDIINVPGGGLAALSDNGGETDIRLPQMNSPARDAGNNCVVTQTCGANNPPIPLTTDQRGAGFPRKSGSAVDIGAAELQAPTAAGTTASGRVTESNGRGIYRVLVTMTDQTGNQRQVYTNQQGYYTFEDVAGGQVYIFSAFHRRYQFEQPTQVQFIGEGETGINFVGTTNGLFRFDIWNLPTRRIG